MALHVRTGVVVSADSKGVIEYWDAGTGALPTDHISFKYKTDTALYDLAKVQSCFILSLS